VELCGCIDVPIRLAVVVVVVSSLDVVPTF